MFTLDDLREVCDEHGRISFSDLRLVLKKLDSVDESSIDALFAALSQHGQDDSHSIPIQDVELCLAQLTHSQLISGSTDENAAEECTGVDNANGASPTRLDPKPGRAGSFRDLVSQASSRSLVSLSPDGYSQAELMTYLSQLVTFKALPAGELDTLLHHVDAYIDSMKDTFETRAATSLARYEQVEKDARELRQSNAMLTEEFARLEEELAHAASFRHLADERGAEVKRLQMEVASQSDDITRLSGASKTAAKADGIIERLHKTIHQQELCIAEQRDQILSLEAAREGVKATNESMLVERASLLEELATITDKLHSEGHKIQGQQAQASQLVEENSRLRERTDEFREILSIKDDVIRKLRRTVDDQTLLIQSLRLNNEPGIFSTPGRNSGPDGSIMSDLVPSGMATSECNGTNNEQAGSTLSPGGTQNSAPDKAARNRVGVAACGTPHGVTPTPPAEADDSNACTVNPATTAPDTHSADTHSADTTATVSTTAGVAAADDDIWFEAKNGAENVNMYSRALKRHRAGRKLVTRKTAQQMSLSVLQRINGILHDLIAAQSERLISALAERDWLESDIEVKMRVSACMIEQSKRVVQTAQSDLTAASPISHNFNKLVAGSPSSPTLTRRIPGYHGNRGVTPQSAPAQRHFGASASGSSLGGGGTTASPKRGWRGLFARASLDFGSTGGTGTGARPPPRSDDLHARGGADLPATMLFGQRADAGAPRETAWADQAPRVDA
eukprot:m.1469960 g.1469960  ORF g.1469960 m.1469960 type:complete len:736 (+) comp25143_c0_seq25:207-2414(+)